MAQPRLAGAGLALVTLLAASPRPHAVEANLSTQGVDDAIVFARMAQREERQAFHDTLRPHGGRDGAAHLARQRVPTRGAADRRAHPPRRSRLQRAPDDQRPQAVARCAPGHRRAGVPPAEHLRRRAADRRAAGAARRPRAAAARRRRHRPDSPLRPVLGSATGRGTVVAVSAGSHRSSRRAPNRSPAAGSRPASTPSRWRAAASTSW